MKAVLDKLTKARAGLILDQPFFGALALRLKLIENNQLPTLAVDGKCIYFNSKFVEELPLDLCKSAIAHEVMHCVFDHMARVGQRDRAKWNQAGDYAINDELQKAGFMLGEGWLHNPHFSGMSADHIYNLLPDNPPDAGQPGGGLCDIMPAAQDQSAATQDRVDWQVATAQAAQAAKAMGKLPGSLERFIEGVLHPQVDWRSVLRRFMQEVAKSDYTFAKANRRYIPHGYYLPSMHSEGAGSIVCVIDTSGSIDQPTLEAFGAEIKSIHEDLKPTALHVIYADAAVNHMDTFGPDDSPVFKMRGGGGTDFRPAFAHVEEQGLQPVCLLYLTDTYGAFPEHEPEYPALWVKTTDGATPWGEEVRIEL